MSTPATTSSDLAAKVTDLEKAGKELRGATTMDAQLDAMLKFGTELDNIHKFWGGKSEVWSRIRLSRLWEGVIDVLAEPPEFNDEKQHVRSVMPFSLL